MVVAPAMQERVAAPSGVRGGRSRHRA
jgi:hypothetical protein